MTGPRCRLVGSACTGEERNGDTKSGGHVQHVRLHKLFGRTKVVSIRHKHFKTSSPALFTEKGSVSMKRLTVSQIHYRPCNQNYLCVMSFTCRLTSGNVGAGRTLDNHPGTRFPKAGSHTYPKSPLRKVLHLPEFCARVPKFTAIYPKFVYGFKKSRKIKKNAEIFNFAL